MNLKTVDFLDVCFDLENNTYQPYCKPNNEPVYIYTKSNDPPNILQELPTSINKQIPDISCVENVFNNPKLTYEKALITVILVKRSHILNLVIKILITERRKRKLEKCFSKYCE